MPAPTPAPAPAPADPVMKDMLRESLRLSKEIAFLDNHSRLWLRLRLQSTRRADWREEIGWYQARWAKEALRLDPVSAHGLLARSMVTVLAEASEKSDLKLAKWVGNDGGA